MVNIEILEFTIIKASKEMKRSEYLTLRWKYFGEPQNIEEWLENS